LGLDHVQGDFYTLRRKRNFSSRPSVGGRGGGSRIGAPMVRQLGDDVLVERFMAERRFR